MQPGAKTSYQPYVGQKITILPRDSMEWEESLGDSNYEWTGCSLSNRDNEWTVKYNIPVL